MCALAAALVALAGCAERVGFEREASAAPIDAAAFAAATRDGAAVYRINPESSFVLVQVGRAGRMAHLGHDHAVASENLEGFVAVHDDPARSRAEIALPLKDLIVDAPAYRDRLGLESEPSDDDIAGTYSNMRKTLDAESYPWARVEARLVSGDELLVSLTLHGVGREFVVPVDLAIEEDKLSVSGEFAFDHGDFELEPFSAAGGLLRVAETLAVRFELDAGRIRPGESVAGP